MSDEVTTYIGQKGYTIYKDCLEIKEQEFIRDSLSVAPYAPKSPVKPEPFPVYRESKNKFYLPRYFGMEHYGKPDEVRLSQGMDIDLKFKGELRDYQKDIVKKYLDSLNHEIGGGGLLDIPCGFGKTVMALYIISMVKKKTIIIVNKDFFTNQWSKSIKTFLPTARIGIIQGPIVDVENKDVVIAMLQSLSGKEYHKNIIAQFGLTIVDECHHISSQYFSRSLFKIVTKYTLGLSATMQRKDGLTKVFKMFLGDIICSVKREANDPVLIKCIDFKVNDEEFNETIYDYRGNPAYSSMITKICDFNIRSEFIIKVIEKELKEKEDQLIMVLAQNRSLLKYMFNAISHRNIASVGYYVGGMKEKELEKSENKKVIVATYAMASEGLDIKTLSTLILATPRTDITQAVGRILRMKHERPLVVDIIDSHEMFKRQSLKRISFYKKYNYKIIKTDSDKYFKDIWTEYKYKKKSNGSNNSNCEKKQKKIQKCLIKM